MAVSINSQVLPINRPQLIRVGNRAPDDRMIYMCTYIHTCSLFDFIIIGKLGRAMSLRVGTNNNCAINRHQVYIHTV